MQIKILKRMVWIGIFGVMLMWSPMVSAQRISFVNDSSVLVFPSAVRVQLQKNGVGRLSTYRVAHRDMKILLTEMNFVLNRLRIADENVAAYQANDSIHQSIVKTLEAKIAAEEARVRNAQEGLAKAEQIARKSNEELINCTTDLEKMGKDQAKIKRKSFVNGALAGLGAGVVITIIGLLLIN